MTLLPVRYVKRYRARGAWFSYYRPGSVSVRLPGDVGGSEWHAAYEKGAAQYAANEAAAIGAAGAPASISGMQMPKEIGEIDLGPP